MRFNKPELQSMTRNFWIIKTFFSRKFLSLLFSLHHFHCFVLMFDCFLSLIAFSFEIFHSVPVLCHSKTLNKHSCCRMLSRLTPQKFPVTDRGQQSKVYFMYPPKNVLIIIT